MTKIEIPQIMRTANHRTPVILSPKESSAARSASEVSFFSLSAAISSAYVCFLMASVEIEASGLGSLDKDGGHAPLFEGFDLFVGLVASNDVFDPVGAKARKNRRAFA